MLTNKRMTLVSDVVVDDVKIASFGAIIDLDTNDISLTSRHIDKDACKVHRDVVRADQKEFEDYAYSVQDMVKNQ
jgi:hypothetical protein